MMRPMRIGPTLLLVGLLLAGLARHVSAQQLPRRELRGVWLTTLSGLDWPAAALRNAPDDQRASLRQKLDNIVRMGLNTVYFQVRSRGNTMYISTREPWAAELTGTLGRDPGWDPLAFAVEECHRRGIEIHAWVNVFKAWSGETLPARTSPPHLIHAHPGWITPYKGEQWIDPGIPEARAWLVELFADLVSRYDVDGLHLDYTRYPEVDFDDDATWRTHGRRQNKADWRRDNVSAFVSAVSARLRSIRPRLELGAAPIGIYTSIPGARGWEGRNAVSQDSRRWLEEGWIDYVCPQVYWGLKNRGSGIDFEALVRDWVRHAAGRNVLIGLAPYKEPVARWLHEHIDACRDGGAGGEVFFRYEHIADGTLFRDRYAGPAIPPSVRWRDDVRPNPPRGLLVDRTSGAVTWTAPIPAADGETATRYAVYRITGSPATARLAALLPATDTRWRDPQPPAADYMVTALDRLRNESAPAATTVLAMQEQRLAAPSFDLPSAVISDPVLLPDGGLLLAYTVPEPAATRVRLMDDQGTELAVLVDDVQSAGMHLLGLERDRVPADVRRVVFECGPVRLYRPFSVPEE